MSNDTNPDDVIVQIGSPSSINVEASARGGAAELGRRLLLAAHAGDSRLVLALMAHGAPFASDWLGTTALHLAAGAGHAHTCGVLLRAGVSRDARTKVERTPLHAAAAAGHTRVVQLLLQHGAAVDCRDMLGMTALHWAAARGHCGAARALLAAGACPHARSRFRHTPADLAARARHARTHTHILEYVNQETQEQKVIFDTEQLEAAPPADAPPAGPAPAGPAPAGPAPAGPAPAGPAPAAPAPRDLPSLDVERGAGAPSPPPPTVLGAVASGRSLVLSDAGKIMLKESEARVASPPPPAPAAPGPAGAGVRLLSIGNKLFSLAPADPRDNVKFLQIPSEKVSSIKYPLKAKQRAARVALVPAAAAPAAAAPAAAAPAATAAPAAPARPTVKIIMNKANFSKLLAQNNHAVPIQFPLRTVNANAGDGVEGAGVSAGAAEAEAGAAAGAGAEDEAARLRRELAAARATIAALSAQLQRRSSD